MINCLFCNEPEPTQGYKASQKDIQYICSGCVQILLQAEPLHLERAYKKAIRKGYESKAKAIESFLIPEGDDGKQINRRRTKERSNRVRASRTTQFKKISTGSSKIRKTIALFKNQQNIKVVS